MTAWVLWTWDATSQKWREARAGSRARMEELASERQAQADDFHVAGAHFVALPSGKRPDQLPLESPAPPSPPDGPPLTHFFHCWRSPEHHACAVALIERQGVEIDELIVRADRAERELRQPA